MTSILIRDGVAWLPIQLDKIELLQTETREALGWKLEDFITRAAKQAAERAKTKALTDEDDTDLNPR